MTPPAPPPRLTAAALRRCERQPPVPFCLVLEDGRELCVRRLLRVLPGRRIVGEADWNGETVLAKIFISADSERRAGREKAGIEALIAAALPTPALRLAAGLREGGQVLLSEFLDAADSVADEWAALQNLPFAHPMQQACLQAVFALTGQMHAAGLVHDDIHLSNFLRQKGRLHVIDGDAVRPLADARQTHDNLALLLAQLPLRWDSQQAQLLAFYGKPGFDTAGLAAAVREAREKRLRKFVAKTVRDCTQFQVRQTFRQFVALARDEADWLPALLAERDARVEAGHRYKDGGTCTVAKVEFSGKTLVIKRYNLRNALHALSRACRPSRAWHSWRAGHLLLHLGIATPEPLALLEERIGPLRRRAFLVNEFCPGKNLREHLAADAPPGDAEADSLLALFDALRTLRITHGDLKANNLLWHAGQVVLIDLDGMRQHRSAAAWQRAWQRDRARFLANWPSSSVLHRWLDAHLLPPFSPSAEKGWG